MDPNSIGDKLRAAFPLADNGLSDILSNLDEQTAKLIPEVLLVVPLNYRNRSGERTDICGTVEEDTTEYNKGYRFFDSNATFFREDGTINTLQVSRRDITISMSADETALTTKPISTYKWVHPQHSLMKSFFNRVDYNVSTINTGHRYLNQMGFVIEIVESSFNKDDDYCVFTDSAGKSYTSRGRHIPDDQQASSKASMFDLIYEIRNWTLFSRHDWSTDRPFKIPEIDSDIPELFNPILSDKQFLMEELLKIILRAHEIAKLLEIDFGFHILKDK